LTGLPAGGILRIVTLTTPPRPDPRDGAAKTLGDLLYTEASGQPFAEADWVRLVQAIAAGDQRALHVLYERSHRIVFTLMLRMTASRQTAEELTVDVFHEIWRRASSYDAAGGTVVGWIMNRARSRAIDRLRFDHRKKRVHQEGTPGLPGTGETDPQEALHFKEQGRRLRDALNTLTPDERAAIETAFFSELTYQEAARRLNQPLGTVKTRIRSGLAKLRDALGDRPGGP
jgi:RNA polymerase sigma-70 factor (ECF subfamily)